MKDIRYLSLSLISDKENQNTYYIIDGQKCNCILNIKEYELIVIDIACKVLNVDNIYIGKAYDDSECEIDNHYGIYYPQTEEINVDSSDIIATMIKTINIFQKKNVKNKDLSTYKHKVKMQ